MNHHHEWDNKKWPDTLNQGISGHGTDFRQRDLYC
jgi:hypothetical protein